MAPTKTASKTAASKKPASHPTFLAMIQECIKANPESSRQGVSRPMIKKFLADSYKLDMSSKANINHISSAITRGEETGALVLPNGPSGRVKLAPKAKSSANKENVAPKKAATPAKKPAAPKAVAPAAKPAAKKAAAAPKAAAKKTSAKPAAKKTSAAKKPAAAKAAAKPAAKKAAPKTAAAKK